LRHRLTLLTLILPLAACGKGLARGAEPGRDAHGFPLPARPVAHIVSPRWSSETARDRQGEADKVMKEAGVRPGMTVADIGAGEGYYTVRLARKVGPRGRVLAEDIVPQVRDALAERVSRERLDMVSVRLGLPDDPRLPLKSFDRVLMVHMYHEIDQPYAFLWNMRPALKAGGRVVVVDADRPTERHGTPQKLLDCEFRAVGYRAVRHVDMPAAGGYVALYTPVGKRPEPRDIEPCDAAGRPL
jgi:ubiquinone/menaquinone biosynthesis C-methylase UbiE